MNIVKPLSMLISALMLVLAAFSQSRETNAQQASKRDDTSFVARSIRNHIMTIRVSQLALRKANSPVIKSLARQFINEDRKMLRDLLAVAPKDQIRGTNQKELDDILNSLSDNRIHTLYDTALKATTGNTVTDSLGSGSSGSGNVHGEDTGTLAESYSSSRNANYSSQGEYAYYNRPEIERLKELDKAKAEDFEAMWINYLSGLTNDKLGDYQAEANRNKGELGVKVTQAVPLLRSQRNMLAQKKKGTLPPGQRQGGQDFPGSNNSGQKPSKNSTR